MRHNLPCSLYKVQPFPMLKKGLSYLYHKAQLLAFFSTFIKQMFLPSKSNIFSVYVIIKENGRLVAQCKNHVSHERDRK